MSRKILEKFRKLDLDLGCLGLLAPMEDDEPYFCTPKGATLLGRAGVDGIHFCKVRGFGDMIFAVSPCNSPGEYVHPVARSFEDFLRLMLACNGTAAPEQGWQWDEKTFLDFLEEYPPDEEQRAALDTLARSMELTPMEEPYRYLAELQHNFDSSQLKFRKEYCELIDGADISVEARPSCPADVDSGTLDWQVYFHGHKDREKPGEEITVNKSFQWGGREFLLPAVYLCADGLVADYFMTAPTELVEEFFQTYRRLEADENFIWTEEETQKVQRENPLYLSFWSEAFINGKRSEQTRGSDGYWLPLDGAERDSEVGLALLHYDLPLDRCWHFTRCAFPWATKRKPALKSLFFWLNQEPFELWGEPFTAQAGERVELTHPITGEKYTLTAVDIQPDILEDESGEDYTWPTHLQSLEYTLDPPLDREEFSLRDCDEGDGLMKNGSAESGCEASAIAFIGGMDGPTAICVGVEEGSQIQTALSSLHFEPAERVNWRPVFRVRELESVQVEVI